MSTILDPCSENYKRTVLHGYFSAGLSPDAAVENLAANFPTITTQEVTGWFARFEVRHLEIGESISINAEGIVIDRSVSLKRELDDEEHADGEPPTRRNPNPPIVSKREVNKGDDAGQTPQRNGEANHVVAQQQKQQDPNAVPIVAVNQNPENGCPQVIPKIEEEDGEDAEQAQANLVNETNQNPGNNRNQREAMARPVRHAQQAVAIAPQNPVRPVPIRPAMPTVNPVNQFLPAVLPFPIAPHFLPALQWNQFGYQLPLLFVPQQVMNPSLNVSFGIPNWQVPQHREAAEQQYQVEEFFLVSITLGKDTVALVISNADNKSETLFIKKNVGCAIKKGSHQSESPNNFIDCAMDALKRVTANDDVEIVKFVVVCQRNVSSLNDIKKFYHGVAQTLQEAPCHIEEFNLDNCADESAIEWSSFINQILIGIKVGPLEILSLKTYHDPITLPMNQMENFTSHVQNFVEFVVVGFVLPIADIRDLAHIHHVWMNIDKINLESVDDYKKKIMENEDFDCHTFHYHATSNGNILTSLQPFEVSTRGTEDFDGMFPLRYDEDNAIFFKIEERSMTFKKLWK